MKFRNPKTGEVFEDIDTAIWNKCRRRDPCDTNCPLFKLRKHIACRDYVISHPAEAARLMGLEVVGGNSVDGMCCDYAEGGPCCDFSENEDCPSRKEDGGCWRPYTEKEEPMEKTENPRICQVLGVEVGEVFTADTPYGRFQRCVIDEEGQILNTGTNVLCYMLNHPDRIICKPRFTEEEVADAKAILRILPHVDTVGRMENGLLYCYDREMEQVNICGGLFPTLRPGQAVRLEDIT